MRRRDRSATAARTILLANGGRAQLLWISTESLLACSCSWRPEQSGPGSADEAVQDPSERALHRMSTDERMRSSGGRKSLIVWFSGL
jgi:hypothetical protein